MSSKLWVRLKPGRSPMTVSTTSRSVFLVPGQAIEVDYSFYRAHLMEYVDIVTEFPKPAKRREKKILLPLDEE